MSDIFLAIGVIANAYSVYLLGKRVDRVADRLDLADRGDRL